MKQDKIKPELASGLKDYLPEEMIPRQKMIDTIRNTMELFGFLPLSTPVLEKMDVLTGGDADFKKQIFKVEGSDKLALRFDLTVPLARVVTSYQLPRPTKRYQYGQVFRGESAQFGRYREFMQFDADLVGSDNPMADAEIIALIYKSLKSLGIDNIKIKIGDRRVLNRFIFDVVPKGAAYNFPNILRIIDKLDKIGWAKVNEELEKLGLTKAQVTKIYEFITQPQNTPEELEPIIKVLAKLGVPKENYAVDLSIARGLEYYTGMVFETVLDDLPEIGSIASGGRYDGLVERFSKEKVPAVGASIGVDRLFAALEKLGKINRQQVIADAFILNFDESCREAVQKTATQLREAGIKTEIYLGKENTFKGQLAFAVSRQYPAVVIIGPKELEKGLAQVKDMRGRKQIEVELAYVAKTVEQVIKNA